MSATSGFNLRLQVNRMTFWKEGRSTKPKYGDENLAERFVWIRMWQRTLAATRWNVCRVHPGKRLQDDAKLIFQ